MSFEYMEEIKQAFLKNVGKVIRRHRTRKGWTQSDLGREAGVSYAAIERYENHKADISAGTMAVISCILGFPMSEYVEDAEHPKLISGEVTPIDDVFRHVILYAKTSRAKKVDDRPPKPGLSYSYETGQWAMVEKIPKFHEDHRIEFLMLQNSLPDDIREEFTKYMESPEREEKEQLLRVVFSMIVESEDPDYIPDPGLKTLSKAVLDFVTNDVDKYSRDQFREYKRYIELLEEAGRDFQD